MSTVADPAASVATRPPSNCPFTGDWAAGAVIFGDGLTVVDVGVVVDPAFDPQPAMIASMPLATSLRTHRGILMLPYCAGSSALPSEAGRGPRPIQTLR